MNLALDETKHSQVYIAVVDDEIDLLCLFKDALTQIDGIEVFTFSDPHMALEHFRLNYHKYGAVVSDYRMPLMNGIQMFDKMKTINPAVARILVSAFEVKDDVFNGCGCVDKFLQKPISMIDLIDEVEASLRIIAFQKTY